MSGEHRCRLPNGWEIACQSQMEAEHIYEDIFDKKIYLRNGVTLWDGCTVFDVGGNIGLFTLFVHHKCRDAVTYTFEPAPPLFAILSSNVERWGGPGAKLINAGVSDRRGTARLTFYPYSSGMSSFHADLEEEKAVLRSIMENQLEEGSVAGMDRIMASSEELLDARFTSRTFDCPLLPLAEVIAAERVERIDLLKIDVQKCELEVLRGLGPADWRRVRQIVMEVHDLDGRLAEVTALLDRHGFHVVVEQDPLLKGSILYNLFAVSREIFASQAATAARLGARGGLQKSALARQRPAARSKERPA